MVTNVSLAEFIGLVNSALKSYQSVLALARSPLADSALVQPLLVLDDVSPTADERGHALRLVLAWAVSRLAPGPSPYPLGTERPYDDPTWRDPHWWRYTILRHRYLEPLHPDAFVEGRRFTETLLALTGITSQDAFFDERNRAIREVAERLHTQLQRGEANAELQALALEEILRPLQRNPEQAALLGIAATFDDVFPRSLLLQMAHAERLTNAARTLDELTAGRYLLMGDGGINLWMSPVLQQFVYGRQPPAQLRQRHLAAAAFYQREEEILKAADYRCRAQDWEAAATVLLAAADALIDDFQADELLAALQRFKAEHLPATRWCEVQILCCDLYRRRGEEEAALAACRQALRVAGKHVQQGGRVQQGERVQQGQLYWRMGKLYEKRNGLQALRYYDQALAHLREPDPTLVEVLKDRAWLYLLRREWEAAERNLQRALLLSTEGTGEEHAAVLDALAHLHLEQALYESAIEYAQQALQLREATGDLLQVAKSFNNLGNFYNRMGEVDAAIAAHAEAIQLYQKLNSQALEAEAWLNQGVVYHTAGRQREAITRYQTSLAISQRLGLLLTEVTAHSNLAEAHAELGEMERAARHWHFGYTLSKQADFAEEAHYLEALQGRLNLPAAPVATAAPPQGEPQSVPTEGGLSNRSLPPRALLSPEEQAVLALAEAEGQVTPKVLMARRHVSKATATRRLRALAASGLLVKRGKGRGTLYLPATTAVPSQSAQASEGTHVSPATLQEFIGPHLVRLGEGHGVTQILLLRAGGGGATWQLGIGFQRSPTLTHFFALEAALRSWCGEPVDLLPLEVLTEEQMEGTPRLLLA